MDYILLIISSIRAIPLLGVPRLPRSIGLFYACQDVEEQNVAACLGEFAAGTQEYRRN